MPKEIISFRVDNKASRISQYGREFWVVPISMIVPGVLNGSKGPLYYPPEEVSRYPDLWDFKPILIGHQNTKDKEVMNRTYVGLLQNTRFDKKLISDGWFDVIRTSMLSPTLHNNLLNGIPFEVSTGLSVDIDTVQNQEHEGKVYIGIARNYRPDHLAVLLDAVGACSIQDGCGVLFNELDHLILNRSPEEILELTNLLNETRSKKMAKKELVDQLITNCGCGTWTEQERPMLDKMSDDKVQSLINADIKHKKDQQLLNAAKAGYEGKEGKYVFNEKTQSWEFVANSPNPNPSPSPSPSPTPTPSPTPPPTSPPPSPTPSPTPSPSPSPSGVTKQDIQNALKDLTPAEWWQMAPAPVQEEAAEVRRIANENKKELVQQWVDNAAPDQKTQAQAWAEKQSITTLREVTAQLPKKSAVANPYDDIPDFSGRAGGVQNTSNMKKPEPMGRYEWDFTEPAQTH